MSAAPTQAMTRRSISTGGAGIVAVVALAAMTAMVAACGPGARPRPYPKPRAEELLRHLADLQTRVASFRADSTMDYWLGSNRVKGTVLLLGAWGARLRFNAENPTGGSVAADMACDGASFRFIDYNKNCQLTGPCDASAIAAFFRVSLDPDDFIAMAVGGTPVLDDAEASTSWDARRGVERLELRAGTRTQVIELDGRDKRWDVVASTLYDDGDVVWKLENKDFGAVEVSGDPDGGSNADPAPRLPGRTRFVQPADDTDLAIRWNERELDIETNPAMFRFDIPAGLPRCE